MVCERRPGDPSSPAFAVHARTLEQLDARGIADELVATGTPVPELRFFADAALDLSTLPSAFRTCSSRRSTRPSESSNTGRNGLVRTSGAVPRSPGLPSIPGVEVRIREDGDQD